MDAFQRCGECHPYLAQLAEAGWIHPKIVRLAAEDDVLVWKIEKRWLQDLTYGLSRTPRLFSTFHSRTQKNATTSIDPEHLAGRPDWLYRQGVSTPGFFISSHPCVDVTTPDRWAIYKL